MFPLRDNIRSRSVPIVNYLLMAANLAVFFHLWTLAQGNQIEPFISRFGLVPSKFIYDPLTFFPTIFTSMFMHASWGHVLGNMWFLYIFGDNVEDNLGHARYLIYYVLMGVGAALAQIYFHPTGTMPMVGASGAIAGILGGYFILFPRAKVLTLFFFFIFVRLIEIPAFFYLGIWFLTQAVNGVGTLTTQAVRGELGGVAWWAHAGGFASGFLLIFLFRRR